MHLVFNFPSNQVSMIILTSIIDSLQNIFLSSHISLSRKHRCGWEGAAPESNAGCSYQHRCPRIDATSECFVFFFFFRFEPTRLQFALTRLQFAPIQANSAKIELYRPNRIVSIGSRNWPKWLKKAEIVWLWIKDKSTFTSVGCE